MHQTSRLTPPSLASLESYTGRPPDLVLVEVIEETVTEIVVRLSGGPGLWRVFFVILQHSLVSFGSASRELRLTVAEFYEGLANGRTA